MLRTFADSLLSLIYPQQCFSCGEIVDSASDGVACENCWRSTRVFDGTNILCKKCGAVPRGKLADGEYRCGDCVEAHFDSAAAAGVYEAALAATVISLKRVPHISERPRHALIAAAERMAVGEKALLMPVPLSRQRQMERGFDQAEIIARCVSRSTGLHVIVSNLVRTGHTPMHRVGMDKKAREMTVQNVFEVRFPRLVKDREIILVDDVFTSGATTSNCAKALKKSGAASVRVLTLARAVMW